MSMTFTKLFSSITESTVWCESAEVRIVWITMLAMADKHGRVWGSVPGLAHRARVPVEVTREALESFLSPDPESRTEDFEGRRIRKIDGGWALLNYGKYRTIRDEDERRAYKAQKERERRAKRGQKRGQTNPQEPPPNEPPRGQTRGQNGQTWTPVDTNGHNAEAEAFKKDFNPPSPHKSTQPDADGDTMPPVLTIVPKNPLGNPEIYAMANLVAVSTPWAVLRSLKLDDVTHAQRVAVIQAAKHEAKVNSVSTGQALDGLLRVVQTQTSQLPPERLQFQGTVETYFKNHTYRVDAAHLTGTNNGNSKGKRTTDAARAVLAKLASGDGWPSDNNSLAPQSGTLARRNRSVLPKTM